MKWSEETKMELLSLNNTPRNTISTVKREGRNIMLWECFSGKGTGRLVYLNGKINGAIYCDIQGKKVLPTVIELQIKTWLGLPI